MKKIFTYICMVAMISVTIGHHFLFAEESSIVADNYTLNVKYNDTSKPGDAVFVRLAFLQTTGQMKKNKFKFADITATLELYLDEKRLDKADFYVLQQDSSAGKTVFLAGIPLSSWWNSKNNYSLKIVYNLPNNNSSSVTLPFALEYKEFVSETIPLDSRNTSIKTDTSSKRMQQINKLNAILGTINADHVYQTTAYIPPTPATRRTSFFADRRVYKYTDGNSSTSLHYGTDYGIPTGSTVKACASGRVVMAEDRISTGWSIIIEHLPGLYSLYYHMSELKVTEGDFVEPGTLIGLSGATGLATGPHLHWEMRLNMAAVNPDYFTTNFTCADEQ
ncbi:MAG: M23 family metallopeptidase [Treponema sp.]|nr:M23 family metallopeptidase [Treponema sp.]